MKLSTILLLSLAGFAAFKAVEAASPKAKPGLHAGPSYRDDFGILRDSAGRPYRDQTKPGGF